MSSWDSGFQSSVGFQIPAIISGIPDSNHLWDSGFQSLVGFRIPQQKFAGFRIPQAKISWIPGSGFPYIGPYQLLSKLLSFIDHIIISAEVKIGSFSKIK